MKKLLLILAVPAVQMFASEHAVADRAWETAFQAGLKRADAAWESAYSNCISDYGRTEWNLCGDAAELQFVRSLIDETKNAHTTWVKTVEEQRKDFSKS